MSFISLRKSCFFPQSSLLIFPSNALELSLDLFPSDSISIFITPRLFFPSRRGLPLVPVYAQIERLLMLIRLCQGG
jgi:hypothetical protein